MAIEPIKGFYVHDEETGTDGIAKVGFEPVSYETINGYIASDGSHAGPASDSKEVYTNLLPCFPGDEVFAKLIWEANNTQWCAIVWYDEDGVFAERNVFFNNYSNKKTEMFTVPDGAYGYRFTFRTFGDCSATIFHKGEAAKLAEHLTKKRAKNAVPLPKYSNWICGRIDPSTGALEVGFRWNTDFLKPSDTKFYLWHEGDADVNPQFQVYYYDENKEYLGCRPAFEAVGTNSSGGFLVNQYYETAAYFRLSFDSRLADNNKARMLSHEYVKDHICVLIGAYSEHLTPIITGADYPSFDTVNNVMVWSKDSILLTRAGCIIPSVTDDVVFDFSGIGTSAIRIYYDPFVESFVYDWYNAPNYKPLPLVAVIRNRANNRYCVSISCPYYLDGKLYGVGEGDAIISDTAWMFGENVKGVNHRGYYTAPENTLPAYKLSKKQGFKYCECDVSMTSDRVPVLLHDDTINRTARNADGTEISETISIGSITYEEALEYDFGIYKGASYAGTPIPTFEEFIVLCRNLGLHPYIELKTAGGYTEAEIQNLVDIVHACGMGGKVSWISFGAGLLTYVKNYDSSARLGFVVGAITSANIETAVGLKTADNEVFLDCSSLPSDLKDDCISAGIPVEVWTVNSASTIEGLDPYISGVTSDNLIAAKVLYDANKD